MTMLAMLKSILWNGPTTVHLQLPLHLTDLCLLSVSGTGAAVGKETNNRKLKPAGIIGQPATATFSAPHKQALDQGCLNLCCLAMSKNYSQWCSFRLDCQISVRTRDWNYFEIARKSQYLLDREKDLEGLWFLSLERDLSLLLSLEKDLQKPNNPIM